MIGLLLLGVALASAAPTVGTVLPVAPTAPPGRIASLPADPLRAAIDARTQGDLRASAWYYEQVLADKKLATRTRAAVNVALGLARLDLGDTNLASAAFTRARTSGTSVAPWGAWYEAWADHQRGRHDVAARECASYRRAWPDGPHADECLVLMGDAWVAAGERGAAIGAYQQYLLLHPDTPREETLRLGIALAVANTDPRQAIPMLQELALDHAYHSTGESAQARLRELTADGFPAALGTDVATRCRMAVERKRCGFQDDAWAQYQELAADAAEDPKLAAWIESQEERFAWGTKQYEVLAARYAEAYLRKPSAPLAWSRYKALARAGMWAAAADQLVAGNKFHPSSSEFRSIREKLARASLLAGRYDEARGLWSDLGKTGAGLGREARWLAAYAAFRLGDFDDALGRLDAVVAAGGAEAAGARYYRARTLEALGRADEADAARATIVSSDPLSWYALLVRANGAPDGDGWTTRNGRWPGTPPPTLPPLTRPPTGGVAASLPLVHGSVDAAPHTLAWGALAWTGTGTNGAGWAPVDIPPLPAVARTEARPDSYQPSFLFDPSEGDRLLARLAAQHGSVLKWAGAAGDLARAGAHVAAAPVIARYYDAIDAAKEGEAVPDAAALRTIDLSVADWRQIFLFVRDDNHAARFTWGTQRLATREEDRVRALRHQFPTAEIDALYRHGVVSDVDPLLVLGLMRQESVYKQWALSPVGALGLMQVMPRTGARIAALMGDPLYSPEILEDPATNVRYGVWYLGRLIDRFDGVWPLAVGSYNGGPHNVSSWLRPWGSSIRMDDFVEQIPYPETRDYIKKVSGYYATYAALYGPPGSFPVVPPTPRGDSADLIDF